MQGSCPFVVYGLVVGSSISRAIAHVLFIEIHRLSEFVYGSAEISESQTCEIMKITETFNSQV